MTAILEKLMLYWAYPFVRYAFVVGVLIALCSSLLGVTLVLKRFSFIGDGLSHVAFGAMAIAAVLQLTNEMPLVMAVTVLSAVLLLRTGQNTKIKGDAAIAMISVGALAVGYLLMNLFSTSSNLSGDVCSTLFGSTSILTLSSAEVWLCVGMSVLVVAVFVLFYNKIFAVTFDENFARATGTPAGLYNLLIAVVVAVIIVLAMNLVGSLLISALVIFPALSAMRVFRSFRGVTVCAAALSVVCALAGMLISILAGTPVGSTIVAVQIALFFTFALIGWIEAMKKRVLTTLLTAVLLLFSACGTEAAPAPEQPLLPAETPLPTREPTPLPTAEPTPQPLSETESGELDLTGMSGTMLYTMIYNMMTQPDDYLGRTIHVKGQFSAYVDEKSGRSYYACYIADAAGCCAQGLEFFPAAVLTYPDDFPEPGTDISVRGELALMQEENGFQYLVVKDASFTTP